MNGKLTQERQIEEIEARAREHFPESEITVQHDAVDNRWLLLVEDNGLTHRFTAATLDGLLTKAEILIEYEDEQDDWEVRRVPK